MTEVLLVAEQLRRRVPGGIGTYVRGILQGVAAMAAAGEPVPALCLHASRPPRRPDPIAALGFPVRAAAVPGPLLTRGWDAGILDVPRGFPVVHAPSLATPPARRSRLAVAVHDLAWRHTPQSYPSRGRRWHEAAFRRVRARAAAVCVPSEAMAEEVRAAGVDAALLHVVPLGADHLPAPDDTAASALLAGHGVAGDFILSVGTLEPRKNLRRLVAAYRAAVSSLPDAWPLVVAGPPGWADGTPDASASGVVLVGPVSDGVLASLYRRARMLAYVPLLEGYGLPPLEAMAAGTPVVASPMPSTGGAVLEVDPRDVDAIAGALCLVGSDEALRARLVADGAVVAAGRTWAASARAHVAVWESLA